MFGINDTITSGDSTLGLIRLENAGALRLEGGVTTLGQVFAQGELPAGGGLVARINGVASSVQVDVKTTWPDGSAKMAVLSVERPDLAPGAALDVTLLRGSAPAGPAIDLAAGSLGHSFIVDLAIAGRQEMRFDVLAELRKALADGTASVWQKGALATEARVELLVPDSSQRLIFDVTVWKGGGITVEAGFNNDRAMEAVGGRVQYSVTATLDGQQVLNRAVDQAQYQNWRETFTTDPQNGGQGLGRPSEGWLNIRHDVAELGRLGVVADYDLSLRIPEEDLAGYAAAMARDGWGEPLSHNEVERYMPTAGGRPDIGITTEPNTDWLISGDARAAAYALGQAEAAGSATWNYWDRANGSWLSIEDYPLIWTDYRGGPGQPGDATSTGPTQQRESYETTGWEPETAHQPDLSFVPYVLTGERWILDNLLAQAAWNLTDLWPFPRLDGVGIVVNTEIMQTRSAAWTMRQIEQAAWAAPDGSAEKAYFTKLADTNWKWLVEQLPAWTAEQGEAHGWLPTWDKIRDLTPWQQDYFASTAISAASRGNADALTYLNWAKNFLIGRFEAAEEGFNIRDGAAFVLHVRPVDGAAPFRTWAEIGAATVAAGLSNGDGWSQSEGDMGRLALATLAGLYELTGDQRAYDAYARLIALEPFATTANDFASLSNYAVTIPDLFPGRQPLPFPDDVVATDGNDTATLRNAVLDRTIDLGAGSDQLTLSSAGPNRLTVRNVETVRGGSADDAVTFATLPAGAVAELGLGQDTLVLGVAGAISASDVEMIQGSAGNDVVTILRAAADGAVDLGAGADRVVLLGATPRITLSNVETVIGSSGTDGVIIATVLDGAVVNLGGGADRLTLSSAGTNSLTARNVEVIQGGSARDNVSIGTRMVDGLVDLGAGFDELVLLADGNSVVTRNVERVHGSAGNDTVRVEGTVKIHVMAGSGNDVVTGGVGDDMLNGGDGDDRLTGGLGADKLDGIGGNDWLSGGGGNDTLAGNAGRDTLEGGAGADRFLFVAGSDSPSWAPDTIVDFVAGVDTLAFRSLLSGAFEWRGTAAFAPSGNTEARAVAQGGGTTVLVDLDGNGAAEMTIHLTGVSPAALLASSFVWI